MKTKTKKNLRTVSDKIKASLYNYRPSDFFYDVESLSNIFTVSQVYPKGPEEYNGVVVSYIDDGYTDINGVVHEKIINSKDDLDFIKSIIIKVNDAITEETPILFEDLSNYNPSPNSTTELGLHTFMKRFGVAYRNQNVKNRGINVEYYPTRETDNDLYEHMLNTKINGAQSKYDVEPMKYFDENSKQFLNYQYNQAAGYRFGYNSFNYDMTILAHFFDELPKSALGSRPDSTNVDKNFLKIGNQVSAFKLRQFNNVMFSKFKKNMGQALVEQTDEFGIPTRSYNEGYAIKSQWQSTNRFLDVAKFNEKQSKISLKRLSGFLGLPIIESKLLNNSASFIGDITSQDEQTGEEIVIPALRVLAELIAYNISDDLNTQRLFEVDSYQSNFNVKRALLEKYPQTVYMTNKKTGLPYTSGSQNIKRNRLTTDSTSAKFIENVIAPDKPLVDIPAISFMYPSARKAKELGVPQTNILEDSMEWAKKNVPNGEEAFKPIYDYYKAYEGRNANPTLHTATPLLSDLDLSDMENVYFYLDANGKRTASMTVFTIGGIHGAEVKLSKLQDDEANAQRISDYQKELEARFGSPEALYAYKPETPNPETGRPYRLGEVPITMDDGNVVTAKMLLKSGSSRKKATWKKIPEPKLFGSAGLKDAYRFTSSGPAHHEDFSSYYPALLSNLEVFYNAETGIDVYYNIYKDRLALKGKLKTTPKGTPEYTRLDDTQTAYKLLLNSASGAADPKSPDVSNNIRKNNAIVSMRIIGQLFAWRIGQAEALAGGRVPSVNTDGLYIMGISKEKNETVLKEVTDGMLIKVDPEEVTKFVSKDTNNRLELYSNEETPTPKNSYIEARGGILTSHNGPGVTSNVDHPAAIDYALTQYLAFVDNAVDQDFNKELGMLALQSIFVNYSKEKAIQFYQWITASKPSTPNVVFQEEVILKPDDTYQIVGFKDLQHFNRVFLTIPEDPNRLTLLSVAAASKLTDKEQKAVDTQHAPIPHDLTAFKILQTEDLLDTLTITPKDIKKATQTKVKKMPDMQNVTIDNRDVYDIAQTNIIDNLDMNAYLRILEDSFNTFKN